MSGSGNCEQGSDFTDLLCRDGGWEGWAYRNAEFALTIHSDANAQWPVGTVRMKSSWLPFRG